MNRPRILIAGTHSGCGKTTMTQGILGALSRRGLRVQAFKSGPDYIDPGHHTQVTGRPSRNLDTWMLTDEAVRELFLRASADADVSVIEAAMGLYDGYGPRDERGSAAHLARLLDCPTLLVVDAHGVARSAAAIAFGYSRFPGAPRIEGVLLNQIAGEGHAGYLRPEIEATAGLPVLGFLPRDPALAVRERHLGLEPASEGGLPPATADALAETAAAHIDMDRLLQIARSASPLAPPEPTVFLGEPQPPHVRIAVARDRAFHFYYADNLDLLRHAGAELVSFSPLYDDALPEETDLLYFGGGYPEVYAAGLAGNLAMRAAVRIWAEAGKPIYAECGGLMYLAESLTTRDGVRHPMVGALPVRTAMQDRRVAIGYAAVTLQRDCILGPAGTSFRGHEFHWSSLQETGPTTYVYVSEKSPGRTKADGVMHHNTLAGYTHIHFGAHPPLASALVRAAREQKEMRCSER